MCTENPVIGKNPVNQESQKLFSIVGGTWNSKLMKIMKINEVNEVNEDQYLNGHERQ